MSDVILPENLELELNAIKKTYGNIQDDWKRYEDEIIPEDKKLAKQIVQFMINVLDHIIEQYGNLDVVAYQEFLAYFDYEFFYGPNGDDRNYLDFDETLNGEPVTEFCWDLKDDQVILTKEVAMQLRTKYSQVLELFEKAE